MLSTFFPFSHLHPTHPIEGFFTGLLILKWLSIIIGLQVLKLRNGGQQQQLLCKVIVQTLFCCQLSKLHFSFCFLAAPSASPANVRGNSTSSTSIFLQWDQVPSRYQNGVILYYTVTYYRRYYSRFPQTVIVTAPTTQTTLTGLNQSTIYSISVSASTSKGRGPRTYISIATGKNSEFPSSLLDSNREAKITMKKEKVTLNQYRKPKGECVNGHAITKTMAKTVTRKCQNSCQWLSDTFPGDMAVRMRMVMATPRG